VLSYRLPQTLPRARSQQLPHDLQSIALSSRQCSRAPARRRLVVPHDLQSITLFSRPTAAASTPPCKSSHDLQSIALLFRRWGRAPPPCGPSTHDLRSIAPFCRPLCSCEMSRPICSSRSPIDRAALSTPSALDERVRGEQPHDLRSIALPFRQDVPPDTEDALAPHDLQSIALFSRLLAMLRHQTEHEVSRSPIDRAVLSTRCLVLPSDCACIPHDLRSIALLFLPPPSDPRKRMKYDSRSPIDRAVLSTQIRCGSWCSATNLPHDLRSIALLFRPGTPAHSDRSCCGAMSGLLWNSRSPIDRAVL
jgi:hypothetical protein